MLQLRDLDLNESINNMTKMLRRTLGEDIELQFKFAIAVAVHPRRRGHDGSSVDESRG